MQRSLPDFEREGIAVFAISYDPVHVLAEFAAKHEIGYALLSDEGSAAIRRLGLLNTGVAEGERAYGVPYPGSYLLDADGIIVEKRFLQSYRERETGAAILERGFGGRSSADGVEASGGTNGVVVRARLDSETYRFSQRLWLTVEFVIEPGLHLYGRPIPDGYTPLDVAVTPFDGIEVGALDAPVPHPFRTEGLDEQFFVYEDRISVALPLTFTRRDGGDLTLGVTVRYQACSANDCLMPVSVTLALPVRAAALVS